MTTKPYVFVFFFLLVLSSSYCFIVGLSNPVDAMYYVQPWMLAVIIPLACIREGMFFRHCFVNICFAVVLRSTIIDTTILTS